MATGAGVSQYGSDVRNLARNHVPVEAHSEVRGRYYTLYATPELVAPRSFADRPRLQGVVLSILKQYAERFYNYQWDVWENQNREYRLLDK